MLQRTLVIIKPDATKRDLHHTILDTIRSCDLQVIASMYDVLSPAIISQLYVEHANQPYYSDLRNYTSSGPCLVAALEGRQAVAKCMEICGMHTNPDDCEYGTVRATWGISLRRNSVHRSTSLEEARREIDIFFPALN